MVVERQTIRTLCALLICYTLQGPAIGQCSAVFLSPRVHWIFASPTVQCTDVRACNLCKPQTSLPVVDASGLAFATLCNAGFVPDKDALSTLHFYQTVKMKVLSEMRLY